MATVLLRFIDIHQAINIMQRNPLLDIAGESKRTLLKESMLVESEIEHASIFSPGRNKHKMPFSVVAMPSLSNCPRRIVVWARTVVCVDSGRHYCNEASSVAMVSVIL